MAEEQIPGPEHSELAEVARKLLRAQATGVLCTISLRKAGWPLGSLVSYALTRAGAPVFLFSELSQHTKNLRADPRASLFVQEAGARNPQAAGRIAVLGRVAPVAEAELAEARARYVAVHPEGRSFAELGDFSFWQLDIEDTHVVGGFAKAGWLTAAEFAGTGPEP
ncbi:MAG TPA: pyridoxamine 5'-phosphate oxidase family protein [Anaeromyxobacteraceae bacterium]|nr:pyridoxamine 5'-phosphate oxidase family protein [Anaeromyxobacteraceae bacterium]